MSASGPVSCCIWTQKSSGDTEVKREADRLLLHQYT
jgi:hypothetical protein